MYAFCCTSLTFTLHSLLSFPFLSFSPSPSSPSPIESSAATVTTAVPLTQLQYDYMTCYLDFFSENSPSANSVAGTTAAEYLNYPVPRWRDMFREVHGQIMEISQAQQQPQEGAADKEESRDKQTVRLSFFLVFSALLVFVWKSFLFMCSFSQLSLFCSVSMSFIFWLFSLLCTGSSQCLWTFLWIFCGVQTNQDQLSKYLCRHYLLLCHGHWYVQGSVVLWFVSFACLSSSFLFLSSSPYLCISHSVFSFQHIHTTELMFSTNPFVMHQTQLGQFAYIKPTRSQSISLPPNAHQHTLALPAEFEHSNVIINVSGAGLSKSQPYYSQSLLVQVIENYGQLQVTLKDTHQPLARSYVKVYARKTDGRVTFYKDGYTDHRGMSDEWQKRSQKEEQKEKTKRGWDREEESSKQGGAHLIFFVCFVR